MTDDDSGMDRARAHVERVRDFFYHLMTWVFVGALLIAVDRSNGTSGDWFGLDFALWVILPWGLGVAGHAVWAFFDDYRALRLHRKA